MSFSGDLHSLNRKRHFSRAAALDKCSIFGEELASPDEEFRSKKRGKDEMSSFDRNGAKMKDFFEVFCVNNPVPAGVINIDADKFKTDQYDPTYAQSICEMKRRTESRYILSQTQLLTSAGGIQTEIKPSMRITLLDWLVRITDEYRLDSGTYSLAIHLLDQALSLINVKRAQFQLLGCACLWLAAKLEELHPPQVENLALIADYCFEVEQLVNYEKKLLRIFEYRPAMPTRYYFIMRFVRAGQCSPREISLAQYITELSFYDLTMSVYPMSMIAAASLHLTLQIMRPLYDGESPENPYTIWTRTLQFYTEYAESQLVEVLLKLREKHFNIEHAEHKYIQRKYEKQTFHRVAQIGGLRLEDVRFDSEKATDVFHGILHKPTIVNQVVVVPNSDSDNNRQNKLDSSTTRQAQQSATNNKLKEKEIDLTNNLMASVSTTSTNSLRSNKRRKENA